MTMKKKSEIISLGETSDSRSNHFTVFLSKLELETLINLLGSISSTMDVLALQALEQKQEDTYKALLMNKKISNHFIDKLLEVSRIPEPSSKTIH